MVKRLFLFILFILILGHNSYSKDRVVAVVLASNLSKFKIAYESFQDTLKTNGVAGSVQFVLSTTNPDPSSWANAVKRAEGHDVDFIIAFGAPLVHSAIKEKVEIPIIFADLYETKLVEGAKGKVGGVYNNIPAATVIKHLSAVKAVGTLHVLYCPFEKETEIQAEKIKQIAAFEKINTQLHTITSTSKIPEIKLGNNDALFLTSSVVLETGISRIVAFANTHNVPVVGLSDTVVKSGGLFAIAPEPKEQGIALGNYVTNYIKTNKLPQNVQLTKVDFIVNLQAAKKLNLTVPFAILNNATKVIK